MHRVFKGRLTTTGMKKIVSRKKFFLKCNVSIAVLLLGIYSNIAAAEASQFSDSGRNSSISQQKVTNVAFVVTGQVFDNTKSPLPGVTVAVKGVKNKATATDINGNYRITVVGGPSSKLVFSFLGMESKEVTIGKQTHINVILEPGSIALEDVEIVGAYGTVQKRADLVSSAFQVNDKQLKNLPMNRIDNLLDGIVPGLKVDVNTDLASSTRSR